MTSGLLSDKASAFLTSRRFFPRLWLLLCAQAVFALNDVHDGKSHLGDDDEYHSVSITARSMRQEKKPTAAFHQQKATVDAAVPRSNSLATTRKEPVLPGLGGHMVASAGLIEVRATYSSFATSIIANCICAAAVALVVLATTRFTFLGKVGDEPLDVISTFLLCGAYVAIAATSDILVKWETQAHGGRLPFSPLRMVFVVEVSKLFLTLIFAMARRSRGDSILPEKADCLTAMRLMLVPALSYSINNALVYFVISQMDFSSLSIWRQTTPLFVAVIWVAIFRRQLGQQRWCALALLVAGTILNSCGQVTSMRFDALVGVVLCSCLTTAVAGVGNEYVMKRCGAMDIDFLCVLLYVQTSVISLVSAIAIESRVVSLWSGMKAPTQGFGLLGGMPLSHDWRIPAIVLLQVLFGFAVARVIRYLGAVPRAVVNSIKELTVVMVAPAFTQSHINGTVVASALVVGAAAALFTLAPSPLPNSKATKAWSPARAHLDK